MPKGRWAEDGRVPEEQVLAWIEQHSIGELNVAGPRASEDPKIYPSAFALVSAIIARTLEPT